MGRIIVTEFITADGVVQAPGDADEYERGGWAFRFSQGDDGGQFKLDELMAAEVQLLGRKTYDGFAAAWPSMEEDEGGFASKMNSMPKYVVSRTLTDPTWQNTTVLSGDVATEVAQLKERVAGDILIAGSARLVRELTDLGLVDEYRLMIFPTLVGAGTKLFDNLAGQTDLTLKDVKQVGPDGVVILTYEPKK